ncbi:MAG: EamA family transporter, partial [Duodenibacillus sp.]|nr:EamA family transporter [Duodenibacillus sp.]
MPLHSLWTLLAMLLYVLMALSAKLLAGHCSAFEIMFYRCAAGFVCVGAYMASRNVGFSTRLPWAHAKRCASGTLSFFCVVMALKHLPLSIEQAIDYTSPLFFTGLLLAVARIQGGERPDRLLAAAVLAGFAGVLMVVQPASDAPLDPLGVAFAFGASLTAVGSSWFIRDLGRQGEP